MLSLSYHKRWVEPLGATPELKVNIRTAERFTTCADRLPCSNVFTNSDKCSIKIAIHSPQTIGMLDDNNVIHRRQPLHQYDPSFS